MSAAVTEARHYAAPVSPFPALVPPPASGSSSRSPAVPRKRARRYVETPEYGKFVRRIVAAYSRRVADADDVDLAEMVALRDDLDAAITAAVQGQRERHGRSWADIGRALGVTKQAASQRYGGR